MALEDTIAWLKGADGRQFASYPIANPSLSLGQLANYAYGGSYPGSIVSSPFGGVGYGYSPYALAGLGGGGGAGLGAALGQYYNALAQQYGSDTAYRIAEGNAIFGERADIRGNETARYLGDLRASSDDLASRLTLQGLLDQSLQNRMAQENVAGITGGANRYISEQQRAAQEAVARITGGFNQNIAGINAQSNRDVAQLGLQGILGQAQYGYLGDVGVAGITGNANRDVAGIQGQTSLGTTGLQGLTAQNVAGIEGNTARDVARLGLQGQLGTAQYGYQGQLAQAGANRLASQLGYMGNIANVGGRALSSQLGYQSDLAGYQNALALGEMNAAAQREAARLNNLASILDQKRRGETTKAVLKLISPLIGKLNNSNLFNIGGVA